MTANPTDAEVQAPPSATQEEVSAEVERTRRVEAAQSRAECLGHMQIRFGATWTTDEQHIVTLSRALDVEHAKVKALEAERDKWRDDYFKARDALHPLKNPPDPKMLRAIADEIDCGRDCEIGYTEHDTGAFVCRKEDRGECGWAKAEELRAFATAIGTREFTLAASAPDATNGGK